ncbi:DUF2085 domain-containing protein [Aggregatilineales bacterium SYSU G02658]
MTSTPLPPRVRASFFLLRLADNWLRVALVLIGAYALLPFAAPTFMKIGWEGPANVLYTLYSPMCHQFAFRSIFLFGEQPFYPREIASTPWVSYETVIRGLPDVVQPKSPDDFSLPFVLSARSFVGNEQIGYKTTLCARDVAIYLALFTGGIVYAFTRQRLRPVPLWIYVIAGFMPIALDGFSQLLSYEPFRLWDVRETAPFYRIATGAMFGLMNAWLAFPYIDAAMQDTASQLRSKLRRWQAR